MSVREYYDRYSARQERVGINRRHKAIQRWLRQFGLAPGMDVLEIGCGVGTQTELIAADLAGSGTLLSVDISPRCVELARQRVSRYANVEVIAADVVGLQLDHRFDVVVMPDVLEHIPIEQHPRLFGQIRRWLKDRGWILIHIPNPLFLEWCQINRPDLLQVIDQPIHTQTLLESIVPSGLYVWHLHTYSIWAWEADYQVIVLRSRPDTLQFRLVAESATWRQRVAARIGRVLDLALPGIGRPSKPQ